jgi:hypothetical protein
MTINCPKIGQKGNVTNWPGPPPPINYLVDEEINYLIATEIYLVAVEINELGIFGRRIIDYLTEQVKPAMVDLNPHNFSKHDQFKYI